MGIKFNPFTSDFLLEEYDKEYCRETGTLLKLSNLKAGTILGKVTASGKYVQVDLEAVDGSKDVAGVLLRDTDATAEDVETIVIVRGPVTLQEVGLVYPDGATDANKITINDGLDTIRMIVKKSLA